MTYVRWHHRPELKRPVLVAAFEGWNDAADAATMALDHLARTHRARRFAEIDAEEFYDFTVARPQARLKDDLTRRIEWPAPTFSATKAGAARELIFLRGVEPGLKWRTFCEQITGVARELNVEMMVTLGALLADVAHTRPVRVMGAATDPDLVRNFGLRQSRYEGPTGILGVLTAMCTDAKIRCASLWASAPVYLQQTPSPKAALALVHRFDDLVGLATPATELEIGAAAYERQVDELLSSEDEMAEWVRRLEEETDDTDREASPAQPFEIPHADALAAEVERFLRDQDRPN